MTPEIIDNSSTPLAEAVGDTTPPALEELSALRGLARQHVKVVPRFAARYGLGGERVAGVAALLHKREGPRPHGVVYAGHEQVAALGLRERHAGRLQGQHAALEAKGEAEARSGSPAHLFGQLVVAPAAAAGVSVRLLLNSMGCEQCRPAYREKVRAYMDAHAGELCETCLTRAEVNPLRAFDCMNPPWGTRSC